MLFYYCSKYIQCITSGKHCSLFQSQWEKCSSQVHCKYVAGKADVIVYCIASDRQWVLYDDRINNDKIK